MPYTWNGIEIDDSTWLEGRNAGVAGALGGMAQSSREGGFAEWLARAASGFAGGQQDYLVNAFRIQQQMEQQRAQEELRRSQIAENEAQAARYQAQAQAQSQQQQRLSEWAAQNDVPLTGVPQLDDDIIRQHFTKAQKDAEHAGLVDWGRRNNLDLDGIPAGALSSFISSQMPNPERDVRISNIESQIADREADNQRAIALEIAKAEIADSLAADQSAAAPFYNADTKRLEPAPVSVSPDFGPVTMPPPKPKTDRRAILEKHGLVPRNMGGGAPTTSGAPKPMPESKTQNPNVPTDEQMATMLKAAQLPPRFADDQDFVESLKREISANVAAGMDRQQAALAAIHKARKLASMVPQL